VIWKFSSEVIQSIIANKVGQEGFKGSIHEKPSTEVAISSDKFRQYHRAFCVVNDQLLRHKIHCAASCVDDEEGLTSKPVLNDINQETKKENMSFTYIGESRCSTQVNTTAASGSSAIITSSLESTSPANCSAFRVARRAFCPQMAGTVTHQRMSLRVIGGSAEPAWQMWLLTIWMAYSPIPRT
jgi:hypothetical protein